MKGHASANHHSQLPSVPKSDFLSTTTLSANAALRQSEEKFQTLFELSADLICIADITGCFREINPAFCKVLGYSEEELLSRPYLDFVYPGDRAATLQVIADKLQRGETVLHFENRYVRKDGGLVWLEWTSQPSVVSGVTFAIARDVTGRKQTEQALQKSQQRFRATLDGSPVPTALNDEQQHITYLNPAFVQTFGYTSKDLPTLADWWPKAYPDPQYRQWVAETWKDRLEAAKRTGTAFAAMELTIRCKDGTNKTVVATATSLAGSLFEDEHMVTLYDITERKKAEDAWEQSKEHYRILFDRGGEGVFLVGLDGKLRAVNDVFARMHGYTVEEMGHMSLNDLDAPDTFQRVPERMARLLAGEALTFEVEHYHKDGHVFPLEVSASLIHSGNEVYLQCFHRDITARKQADTALRESEFRWKFAIEGSGDGLWDWDVPAGTVFFSHRWKEMLGLADDEVSNRLDEWSKRIHPDDLPQIMADIKAHFDSQTAIYANEHRVRCKDGSWKWILDRGVVLSRDVAGKPQRMIGTHRDIDSRKQAEALIRKKDIQFRKLSANVPDLIYQFTRRPDGSYYVPVASEGIKNIFGCSPEDVLVDFAPIARVLYPADVARVIGDIEYSATHLTQFVCEFRVQIPGKPIQWILSRSTPERLSDGSITWYGFNADITERKQAEAAVAREQALSKTIIDSIPGAFYMLDDKGAYVRWNVYQRDTIVGKPEDQVAGTSALGTIHPDDREFIQMKIASVLGSGREETVEARVLLRGGPDFRWLLMTGRPITIEGSSFLVGIGIDITERKQAEVEHTKLQTQLAQAQKMESVGRLAGGVAHDFNNLLQGIMSYVDLCQDEIDPAHPVRGYLDEITLDARRSADLVRQLLAFARKQTIAPKVLDLNDAVAGTLKMLRHLIGEDIDLALLAGHDVGAVSMDPSQLDQILANLTVNARDAIGGVGKLTIETLGITLDEAFCAEHEGCTPGKYALLMVSDNGCGMDKETLSHIFEPFFTTKGVGEGTGLGLATVFGIVKQNNGFINVYSESGKGTTFKIYLPSHVREETALAAVAAAAKPPHGTETVLFVEDAKSIRITTHMILEDLGYTVLVAADPETALRLVAEHPGEIHLLITDVVMPGMSGRDLSKRLLELRPSIKCLFISGFTRDVIAQRGILDDGMHFMPKPFVRDELARKVREVLGEEVISDR